MESDIDLPSCVGLIPAAGRATRLALRSGSKELLVVPDLESPTDSASGDRQVLPVCEYLLRLYERAGIHDIAIIQRAEKVDLTDYFSSARMRSRFSVTTLVTPPTPGSVHSLALGCRQFAGHNLAIGFPDIILTPAELCRRVLQMLKDDTVDVCLGAIPFAPDQRPNWDFCELDRLNGSSLAHGRVTRLIIKPAATELAYAWTLAVWRPVFSAFLLNYLDDPAGAGRVDGEVSMSHVLQAAIDAGMHVACCQEPAGHALDIGQPERLARARALVAGEPGGG